MTPTTKQLAIDIDDLYVEIRSAHSRRENDNIIREYEKRIAELEEKAKSERVQSELLHRDLSKLAENLEDRQIWATTQNVLRVYEAYRRA